MKRLTTYKSILTLAIFSAVNGLVIPATVQAADLTASGTLPWLTFDDTDAVGPEWRFRGYTDHLGLYDVDTSGGSGSLSDPVLYINRNDNNANSLNVDSSGDINLANGSVFIDRSATRMGIGTVAPSKQLSISSASPTISLRDTGNPGISIGPKTWEINSNSGSSIFDIANVSDGNEMFKLNWNAPDNTLVVHSAGVGVGTSSPAAKLDVRGDINATFSGSSPDGLQTLFKMSANNTNLAAKSDAGFVLENDREGFSYAFRTENDIDGFSVSKQGSGFRELQVLNSNNTMAGVELRLGNGAANVNGVWLNASSRSYKKNIHDLSGGDAMQALRGLKSVTYQYKQDADNEQMVGFIAEDVPKLIATHDRKTLDPMKIVAVLTKAVQEQDKALISKDRKISEMEAKMAEFDGVQQRLSKLELILKKLTSSSSALVE